MISEQELILILNEREEDKNLKYDTILLKLV